MRFEWIAVAVSDAIEWVRDDAPGPLTVGNFVGQAAAFSYAGDIAILCIVRGRRPNATERAQLDAYLVAVREALAAL